MKKILYWIVNLLVILLSGCIYLFEYKGFGLFEKTIPASHIIVTFIMVLCVHFIKAIRLYGVLYGNSISFSTHIKQYCKTVPVSVILPYKIGDLFRMYCYGHSISNYFKGAVIILFDRFIDTLALVSLMIIINILSGTSFTMIFYVFLIFLILLICVYLAFTSTYSYWNRYFLSCKTSVNKNKILKLLKRANEVYNEVVSVIKGRGIIMYIFSILAWIVEIGGILILSRMNGENMTVAFVSDYLFSALSGMNSVYLKQFVSMSVILLLGIYVIMFVTNLILMRKKRV